MNRPTLQDFSDKTQEEAYKDSSDLFRYAQALNGYIDLLEARKMLINLLEIKEIFKKWKGNHQDSTGYNSQEVISFGLRCANLCKTE